MNKFIKEQEKQEILVYAGVFLVVFFLLFNFVGVSFDFTAPSYYLEPKNDFGEIKAKLERANELYNINELRTFELIPAFDGTTGKDDPFSRDIVSREETEETEEGVEKEIEEETETIEEEGVVEETETIEEEEVVEETETTEEEVAEETETIEEEVEIEFPELPEELTTN